MTANTDDQILGQRIREARESARLDAQQLARRVGVELASLEAWEEGSRAPRANRLTMLAGVLGVSPGWLLQGLVDGGPGGDERPREVAEQRIERLRAALNEGLLALDELERVLEIEANPDR